MTKDNIVGGEHILGSSYSSTPGGVIKPLQIKVSDDVAFLVDHTNTTPRENDLGSENTAPAAIDTVPPIAFKNLFRFEGVVNLPLRNIYGEEVFPVRFIGPMSEGLYFDQETNSIKTHPNFTAGSQGINLSFELQVRDGYGNISPRERINVVVIDTI